jgi:hypothetical protein
MLTFDLTPDPKVLLALTHTPMQPMDALCELIDNALDSFNVAKIYGSVPKNPAVLIELPKLSDINSGIGIIRVRDNGLGLTAEQAEKALKAGFTGNNPYDNLGLFGMGFNISTGKLGSITNFMTTQLDSSSCIQVTIDLEKLRSERSFKVPVSEIPKPKEFQSGTIVEVSSWWPEGNPNSGFVRKLVQYGMPRVRDEIGRRYASILRNGEVKIYLNGEPCAPYEHCVWGDSRFVERKGHGKIPAVFRFDELIGTQRRCASCTALVSGDNPKCEACGSSSFRTIEERIRGWLGIQRFDDQTEYGVDLIRNGRSIRIGEKAAFFEFTDEFKKTTKDYPIDSPYGRIVGEIHINHVPVDFLKQDFQRSSPEWQRALSYLRGDSSLQPNQAGADLNKSPVFRLYQGYRRVRSIGRGDMYMGKWDPAADGPTRISRDIEKEYYDKFKKRLPGFYDDTEWWKLVEQAEKRPLEELVDCPECGAQNLRGHDVCNVCHAVLIGKACISLDCKKTIPQSAASCPHCGTSQIIEVIKPWSCEVCFAVNSEALTVCSHCTFPQGTPHPLSRDRLAAASSKSDELSIKGLTLVLSDGSNSNPLDVDVAITKDPLTPTFGSKPIPLHTIKTPEKIEVYIDMNHPIFRSFRLSPEQLIAAEVALVLYDSNRRLSGAQHQGVHTLSTLTWQILSTRWKGSLEDGTDRVRNDIQDFFNGLRERLPVLLSDLSMDIFNDMEEGHKSEMFKNMLAAGVDLSRLESMKTSGQFLFFVSDRVIADLFKNWPDYFFDGKLWNEPWNTLKELTGMDMHEIHYKTRLEYANCLDDLVFFLTSSTPDVNATSRARLSLKILARKLV